MAFTPIRTERLLLRQARSDDAPALAERRSDPEVARYQNWSIPYPIDRAQAMVDEVATMDGPENEEWWMATVCDAESDEILGDLALHLTSEGRTAEIGYTFFTRFWGRGYAVEALGALVAYLFQDRGVARVFGMLHPDNPASAMVMERTGFLYEGHTRSSFWLDGEVSDDLIYGLTRADWEAWVGRPAGPPEQLTFVPVNEANYREVEKLQVHKSQERFVATVTQSYADALFPNDDDGTEVVPWMRAIMGDGEYVGFVMLSLPTPEDPTPYLWRFLVDRLHQRRGIGRRALGLVVEECRSMKSDALLTSWVDGKGSPGPFYQANGFEPTGRIVDGEIEGRLALN